MKVVSARYKFVYRAIDRTWKWRLHGQGSVGGFSSDVGAARDLAAKLVVPVGALKRSNPTIVQKPSPARGVSWHSGKMGWLCRANNESTSKAFFTCEEAAAAAKVKISNSQIAVKATQTLSPYKFVFRAHPNFARKKVTHVTWAFRVCKRGHSTYQSGFSTALDAAKQAAHTLGVPLSSLKKAKTRKPTKTRVRELLKPMLKIFKASSTIRAAPYLPADFADLLRRSTQRNNIACVGVLRSCIVCSKYGPFRDAISGAVSHFKVDVAKAGLKGVRGVPEVALTLAGVLDRYRSAAAVVENIVKRAVRQASGKRRRELKEWRRCVGAKVHHHHGFVPLLVDCFGLAKRRKNGPIILGEERVRLEERSESIEKNVCKFLYMAEIIESEVSKVLTSARDGKVSLQAVIDAKNNVIHRPATAMPPSFDADGYHTMWLFRCILTSRLFERKIRLQLDEDTTLLKLAQAWTTIEQQHLEHFASRLEINFAVRF